MSISSNIFINLQQASTSMSCGHRCMLSKKEHMISSVVRKLSGSSCHLARDSLSISFWDMLLVQQYFFQKIIKSNSTNPGFPEDHGSPTCHTDGRLSEKLSNLHLQWTTDKVKVSLVQTLREIHDHLRFGFHCDYVQYAERMRYEGYGSVSDIFYEFRKISID
ncbi:hypothetical protein Tco_0969929 [Tanacetum coccineum]